MTPAELEQAVAFSLVMAVDPAEVVQTLLLAFVLGIAVALLYRQSLRTRIVHPVMVGSMVLMTMTSAMVMMAIGSNLARAFTLVGALSIVRFRTHLKSPWDIGFIFLSLVVGIATGTGAWVVAVGGAIIIGLAVIAIGSLPAIGVHRPVYGLKCEIGSWTGLEDKLEAAMASFVYRRWLVELRSSRFGETLLYHWRVQLHDPARLSELVRILSDIEGVERVLIAVDDEASGDSEG
jgi:uncharacterized membrane protein YhiD involved in acid resistance